MPIVLIVLVFAVPFVLFMGATILSSRISQAERDRGLSDQ